MPTPVWRGLLPWRTAVELPLYEEQSHRLAPVFARVAWAAILDAAGISEAARRSPDCNLAAARSSTNSTGSIQRAANLRRVWCETVPLWRWITQLTHGSLHVVRWKTRCHLCKARPQGCGCRLRVRPGQRGRPELLMGPQTERLVPGGAASLGWRLWKEADRLRQQLVVVHRSLDMCRRAREWGAHTAMLHQRYGQVVSAATAGLVYGLVEIESWDLYIGETGGPADPRFQKHWRDLLASSGSRLYRKMAKGGAACLCMLPLYPTNILAPLRRERVCCEVQTMRLYKANLNERGYATATSTRSDDPGAPDVRFGRSRRVRAPMRLRGRPKPALPPPTTTGRKPREMGLTTPELEGSGTPAGREDLLLLIRAARRPLNTPARSRDTALVELRALSAARQAALLAFGYRVLPGAELRNLRTNLRCAKPNVGCLRFTRVQLASPLFGSPRAKWAIKHLLRNALAAAARPKLRGLVRSTVAPTAAATASPERPPPANVLLVRLQTSPTPSIRELADNTPYWRQRPTAQLTCACASAPAALDKLEGHVLVRLSAVCGEVLRGTGPSTRLQPDLTKETDKLMTAFKKVPISLKLEWAPGTHRSWQERAARWVRDRGHVGLAATTVREALRSIRKDYALAPIDRDRGDMTIACPRAYRMLALMALESSGSVEVGAEWLRTWRTKFTKWTQLLEYTPHASFQGAAKHRFGTLIIWIKKKVLGPRTALPSISCWGELKARPLVSYRRHYY